MDRANEHMASIEQIRSIMEKSTTFISLTGLSGVLAGMYAVLAFVLVAFRLDSILLSETVIERIAVEGELQIHLIVILACALVATLLTALILTVRKARLKGQSIPDSVSRRFAVYLFVPLGAGGLFAIALAYQGLFALMCPVMLLFFGLALLTSARFAPMDMFWLGIAEIVLGLVAAYWHSLGLIMWVGGFGIATTLYGTLMFIKYER